MVFTQYTDTMDFLRDELKPIPGTRIMCFSGRGGEVPSSDGGWTTISRDDAKQRFKAKLADILLCTDAAAEGLNFQFCGALINYDMPWNPMRVEQRIGRIDRLGQQHRIIRIINLHYADTVEADVYRALRNRIGLFQTIVGRLQPILSRLPQRLAETVLTGSVRQPAERSRLVSAIENEVENADSGGFDLDATTSAELTLPPRPEPLFDLDNLDQILNHKAILPPGTGVNPLAKHEYAYQVPGMVRQVRITTDRDFYEEHAESVEFWSPGNPLFPQPEFVATAEELAPGMTIHNLLEN